jgi:hypothetical protein
MIRSVHWHEEHSMTVDSEEHGLAVAANVVAYSDVDILVRILLAKRVRVLHHHP